MSESRNTYVVCPDQGEPYATTLSEMPKTDAMDLKYISRIFRHLEENHGLSGFDVFVTHNHKTPIPESRRKSIVVMMGEEHCRTPKYASSVDFLLSRHAHVPLYFGRLHLDPGVMVFSIEYAYNAVSKAWTTLAAFSSVGGGGKKPPILALPVGYAQQDDLTPPPILERRYLASFVGSILQTDSGLGRLKGELLGPKTYIRRQFARELLALEARFGADRIKVGISSSYAASRVDRGKTYSQVLSQTQICLSPRGAGNAGECTRTFEGLRYGCVVINDVLPDRWFYRGSPIIQVDNWRQMHEAVGDLASDPASMERLASQGLAWWENVCGERPVAAYLAGKLGLVEGPSQSDLPEVPAYAAV